MLYYPHYTPSKYNLRSLLMFCDAVQLIVPSVDQAGVERRQHIEELLNTGNHFIDFRDPTFRYTGWVDQNGVLDLIERLVSHISIELHKKPVNTIRADAQGNVSPGQDAEIFERWKTHKWRYVAEEKFPKRLKDLILNNGATLRVGHFRNPVTGCIVEHNAVLCHPKLAKFVLCRMAREASLIDGIPSITFESTDFQNHLYDETQKYSVDRFRLLQGTMDLLVPDNIGSCNIFDFQSMHSEYQGVRREIWRYFEDVIREENLDLNVLDQKLLVERLENTRDRIEAELAFARRQIGRQRFASGVVFSLEAAMTVGLAAAGAHYGGPLVAAGTAGLGIAIARAAKKMSTIGEIPDGSLRSIAMSKARLEKRGRPGRYRPPSYWV